MNQKQSHEENRIHASLSACNPLNNEDFCDEIRRSYLLYGDDSSALSAGLVTGGLVVSGT